MSDKKETFELKVSDEIVKPIVKTHIHNAVVEALGGESELIKKVVDEIISKKVMMDGSQPRYSSDKAYPWIEVILTKKIKEFVEAELRVLVEKSASVIKDALMEKLKTKRGSSAVADALLAGLTGTMANNWRSKIEINIEQINRD